MSLETKAQDNLQRKAENQDRMSECPITYPEKKVVLPVVVAVCLTVFLVSLDRTIIGVAVPAISDEFQSFSDISWYESAYLLPFAALQLPLGKIYTFFSAKWTFVILVAIFEVGSIISAASTSSTAFIIGRAVSGIGGAGTTAGAIIIFAQILPLEKRPKYQGLWGASFGLAAIAGPLLGGVFATKTTWRWCFWINLPIGGLALLVLFWVLPNENPPRKHGDASIWQRVKMFDPLGTSLLIPALILLLLGLQQGGKENDWAAKQTLVMLILGGILLIVFGVVQLWVGENGTIPPRIIRQRTIAAATVVSLGFGAALIIVTFYLPIWYQAIKELSAVAAGVRMLAYFLISVVFVITSGILVSKIGYYTPFLIVGMAFVTAGCGVLTTLRSTTTTGTSIGFQVIVGIGIGLSLAQCNIAAQTVLSPQDLPIGATLLNFANFLGGTIFVSVCQGILASTLRSELRQNLPDLDIKAIFASGASDLSKLVAEDQLPVLIDAYNDGISNLFYCALAVAAIGFLASWFLEWKSVKSQRSDIQV